MKDSRVNSDIWNERSQFRNTPCKGLCLKWVRCLTLKGTSTMPPLYLRPREHHGRKMEDERTTGWEHQLLVSYRQGRVSEPWHLNNMAAKTCIMARPVKPPMSMGEISQGLTHKCRAIGSKSLWREGESIFSRHKSPEKLNNSKKLYLNVCTYGH